MTAWDSILQDFHPASPTSPGATMGAVTSILRLEGLLVLACATISYGVLSGDWLMFALLFLVPDISMMGYLINRSVGAMLYNLGHSYLSPGALALLGFTVGSPVLYSLALIWVGHIGFDRLLGYGLKYPTAFGATHLGLKGKRA